VLEAIALAVVIGSNMRGEAAGTQPSKIGFIDLQRTLQETKAGKTAKAKLEAQKTEKQKQVNEKKEALMKAKDEFDKQKLVLKPDAAAKRQQDLETQYAELQQTFMQLQQDLAKQEAQLTKDIFTKAATIIESIAKRDGYTMIVEKNEGAVLWGDRSFDITEEVDKRLDAGEGQQKEAPPASAPAKK
jgi:outer membrane protein